MMRSSFLRACTVLVAAALGALGACKPRAAEATSQSRPERPLLDSYPVVVIPADQLAKTRAFYVDTVGLDVVFDSTWFVALGDAKHGKIDLGIMAHDHPSNPPGPDTFSGKGVFFTVQVADARAAHERATRAGVAVVHPLTDEPWGQRRFMVRDPSGTAVDVVQQIDPAPGFWDKYMTPAPASLRSHPRSGRRVVHEHVARPNDVHEAHAKLWSR